MERILPVCARNPSLLNTFICVCFPFFVWTGCLKLDKKQIKSKLAYYDEEICYKGVRKWWKSQKCFFSWSTYKMRPWRLWGVQLKTARSSSSSFSGVLPPLRCISSHRRRQTDSVCGWVPALTRCKCQQHQSTWRSDCSADLQTLINLCVSLLLPYCSPSSLILVIVSLLRLYLISPRPPVSSVGEWVCGNGNEYDGGG